MSNMLRHLISSEPGTSAFLATLLDPASSGPVFDDVRNSLKSFLAHEGIETDTPAPSAVEAERLNVDLVVVWSPWVLLIENKIAAASVTKGQLQQYYDSCRLQLDESGSLIEGAKPHGDHRLCVIYLTPTEYTGTVEFDALIVQTEKGDNKKHLAWPALFAKIDAVDLEGTEVAVTFVRSGVEQIKEVIKQAKAGRLPDDESRVRLRLLIDRLRERLTRHPLFHDLKVGRWSDRDKEQLFWSGPAKTAYVGIYLSYKATEFPSQTTAILTGHASFEAAAKCRSKLRDLVATESNWPKRLGVDPKELHVDASKASVSWRFSLDEMDEDELVELVSDRVTVFARTFAKVLAESPA